MATNRRSAAGCANRCGARWNNASCDRLRLHTSHRTPLNTRMVCCRPRLGREEGTVNQLRAAHLASAGVSETAGPAQPDWWMVGRGGAQAPRPWRRPSTTRMPRHFREHAALSAVANDGTAISIFRSRRSFGRSLYAQLAPIQWPVTVTNAAAPRACRRRQLLQQRPARFLAITHAPGAPDRWRLSTGTQHRPGARPTGTP